MEFKNKKERTGCMVKKQQDKHTGTHIIKTKIIDSTENLQFTNKNINNWFLYLHNIDFKLSFIV